MRITVTTLFAALVVTACGSMPSKTTDGLNEGSAGSSATTTTTSGSSTSTTDGSTPTPTGGTTSTTGGSTPTSTTPPPAPDPTLARVTYQAPTAVTTRTVASSNSGGSPSVSAYSYSVFPASGTWSPLQTVPYPVIDLGDASQFGTGTFTDAAGVSRLGYRFTIAQGQAPDWGGSPRVEFDSAAGADQNPGDGMPSPNGWAAGIVTEGSEMWFSWSMYLASDFSLTQPWATLFQLHAGNTNLDPSSPLNGWPNPGWPGINVENGAIAFGLGPDATSPGQVWVGKLADYRGKWTDIAVHAKFSAGSDGLLEFYLNGVKVGTKTGANMVYGTLNGTPRWYYMKQGYYRDASVSSTDTVYQTPILVSVNG